MTILADNISLHLSGFDLLRNVSLEIEAGKVTAIVGPNGAGKSSLLKVISGEMEPTIGTVSLNQQPLFHWSLDQKAQMMAVLPQHALLNFPFTADEVVALGRIPHQTGSVKDAQIVAEALQLVDASYLQKRFYTQMSGGEKQRVAIARTLLKNPPILILDEATSALDSRTESEIQATLERISERRTTIIIAHRLSTVVNADQIIVLEAGRVAEKGTHVQLLRKNGLYADMWARQQSEAEEDAIPAA